MQPDLSPPLPTPRQHPACLHHPVHPAARRTSQHRISRRGKCRLQILFPFDFVVFMRFLAGINLLVSCLYTKLARQQANCKTVQSTYGEEFIDRRVPCKSEDY